MVFALIGNQNCGKTTLFNQLTGSNQHVGNFPGVTVEKKEGVIKKAKDATVVDLPGIYSLSPYTAEEVVTRDFLIQGKPDAAINIVDATNIERNLYLTLQVIELGLPMVLALNMMDEVTSSGGSIDIKCLEEALGIPVVPISASKNEGVSELVDRLLRVAKSQTRPKKMDFCTNEVHRAIHSVAHLIEDHCAAAGIPGPAPDGAYDQLGAPQLGTQLCVGQHPVHRGLAPLLVRQAQAQAVYGVDPSRSQSRCGQAVLSQHAADIGGIQLAGAVDRQGEGVIAQLRRPAGAVLQRPHQGGGVALKGAVCPDGAGLHSHRYLLFRGQVPLHV